MNLPILQKPKFKEPCNRCGECCRLSLCYLAEKLFVGSAAPCPALEFHDGQFSCGMIVRPDFYICSHWPNEDREWAKWYFGTLAIAVLGIGQGCGMPDEEIA